jgi:putative oxidoreductase
VVCAGLLVLGLFTRVAALGSAITMGTAFWFAHGTKLTGAGNGELAFVYLGVYVALFIAGGGKFSLDAKMGAKG